MDDKFLASAVAKMKTEARAAPAAPAAGSSPATAAAPASATKVGVAEARPSGAVGVGGSAGSASVCPSVAAVRLFNVMCRLQRAGHGI